ncbi:MAG: tetratricopeptide repeat protein, partial [Bacteroidia bacterium]
MKKTISILALMVPVMVGYAQKGKEVNAISYYRDYTETKDTSSLRKAKENIDLAAEHEDTKDNAKTQAYKGLIYMAIYEANKKAEEDKLMSIADPNKRAFAALQSTPTTELGIAYQAFKRTKELDVKENYTNELKNMVNIGINFDNTGRSFYNAKKYPQALAAFEGAYNINPNDTTVLYFCATSADLAKDYPKAVTYYTKMLAIKQGQANTYTSLMNVYLAMKDTTAGMDILKKGRSSYPNDMNLVISETNYFLRVNKSQEALNNLNIAIQAKPTDANLYLVRGNIYDNLANPKDANGKDLEKPADYDNLLGLAETDYKKAIELKNDYFDAYYNLGVLYNNHAVELNKQADKLTDLKKFEVANAKTSAMFMNAMPVLEKALELNPTERNTM